MRALSHEPGSSHACVRKDYFDRVAAIDFTVSHYDGNKPDDIPLAGVINIGVSRCAKTPLSMHLAVRGWKVANTSRL